MTEPGWRKTKDPMYKCLPPKRWISAPMARASGMGERGFCEEPASQPIPVPTPKPKALQTIDGSPPCSNLSDVVVKYKKSASHLSSCKHLRQIKH